MMITDHRLIPLPDSLVDEFRKRLVNYWNAVAICDELGGVPESLVRETEIRVTDLLLSGDPWDVYEASRITAEFEYILSQSSCS
jgi:hypothetical protein